MGAGGTICVHFSHKYHGVMLSNVNGALHKTKLNKCVIMVFCSIMLKN